MRSIGPSAGAWGVLVGEAYAGVDDPTGGAPAILVAPDPLLFHAEVASERDDGTGYTIDDVADGIVAKLVRRHPQDRSDRWR